MSTAAASDILFATATGTGDVQIVAGVSGHKIRVYNASGYIPSAAGTISFFENGSPDVLLATYSSDAAGKSVGDGNVHGVFETTTDGADLEFTPSANAHVNIAYRLIPL